LSGQGVGKTGIRKRAALHFDHVTAVKAAGFDHVRIVFDTVGTDHDTILYVRSSCTGAFVACNDDIDTEMGNVASRVSVTATMAGQEFIVVVDGFAAEASGEFTVNVTMGTTPDAGPSTTDAAVSIPDAGLPDAPIAFDAFAG
jgi:hypothetical protein